MTEEPSRRGTPTNAKDRPATAHVASRAVVLAAGRGTRMREKRAGVRLDERQREMAERGLKGLIPFDGRPFLSYVIDALAEAGIREVCLVVRPGDDPIRRALEGHVDPRLRITFVVQEEPLGSAHALLAAEQFVGSNPFLVLNADNVYPPSAIAALLEVEGNALAGFQRDALVQDSNSPPERIAAYALVTATADGCLDEIVEKPTPEVAERLAAEGYVSMTLWRFGPAVFDACRAIPRSERGEYEIPDAVALLTRECGECVRVVPVEGGVLDLSSREDIPTVAEKLAGRTVWAG